MRKARVIDMIVFDSHSPAATMRAFARPGIDATTARCTSSGSEVEMPFG